MRTLFIFVFIFCTQFRVRYLVFMFSNVALDFNMKVKCKITNVYNYVGIFIMCTLNIVLICDDSWKKVDLMSVFFIAIDLLFNIDKACRYVLLSSWYISSPLPFVKLSGW